VQNGGVGLGNEGGGGGKGTRGKILEGAFGEGRVRRKGPLWNRDWKQGPCCDEIQEQTETAKGKDRDGRPILGASPKKVPQDRKGG